MDRPGEPWRQRARGADVLAIQRQALCNSDDPCHAYYDVFWSQAATAPGPRQPASTGGVSRYTRYTVTLTLGAVSRTYQAMVLYRDESDGIAVAEVIDNSSAPARFGRD